MKVAIIGTGYVGLTTGVCLADIGHEVFCVDNDPQKLEILKEGRSPIYEPGMEELLKKNCENGRLSFSSEIAPAAKEAEVIFICVNTPTKKDGMAELKFVEKAAKEIALAVGSGHKIIVDKSTVPVKTAEKVKDTIHRYGNESTCCEVISNPEFLKEGSAIRDTMEPDRIVIGSDSEKATGIMKKLYGPIVERTGAPVRVVSVRSAELIKHGANTFLSIKISYANLIAQVCEEAKADALEVLEAIGLDERIGKEFLNPGIGFGGSCFPKDIAAFKKTMEILGVDNTMIKAVEEVNENAWKRFVSRVEKELWVLDGKTIGILGLAFKPDTDDLRNAPALKIAEELIQQGAAIKAYDPQAMDKAKGVLPEILYCEDPYMAAEGAEALLVCTEWPEFRGIDMSAIKEKMLVPLIFDGRNVFDKEKVKQLGMKYFGIGRR
jgi:UDPglucose 6-dehydrogenase